MPDTNNLFKSSIASRKLSESSQEALRSNLEYNKFTFSDGMDTYLQSEPIHRYSGPNRTYRDYIDSLADETDEMDMAGTVLSGQGIGWDGNSLVDNFDVRNTIAGRVLSATGVINDTPLGKIANDELVKVMTNRVMFNAQSETLGRINIDPINAIKGGDIIRPDYSITIGYNTWGKVAETVGDLTGIQLPIDQLSDESSIWKRGNSQSLIKNTGKGQIVALFSNLKHNKYAPDYEDDRVKNGDSLGGKHTYGDAKDDFRGLYRGVDDYDTLNPHPDSLLHSTKEVFGNPDYIPVKKPIFYKDKQMITGHGFTQSTVDVGGMEVMSHGSGVKSKEGLDGDIENVFGRVFTKDNKYDTVGDLQKHRGLDYKDSAEYSVLDSNGFVRVSPYHGDNERVGDKPKNMKKFMLSLENLAWADDLEKLPISERGPGDRVNGTSGRIMWFPPYDLSFTDTTSVNWESTNFIGRGEPIYTYNNTERRGVLQFKIIIDYPSYMEDAKGVVSDDVFNSITSGVLGVDYSRFKNMSLEEKRNLDLENVSKPNDVMDSTEIEPADLEVFYENDIDTFDENYQSDGFNSHVTDDYFENIKEKLENECPSCTLVVKGTASQDGTDEYNKDLARRRAEKFKGYLENRLGDIENKVVFSKEPMGAVGCKGEQYPIESECKTRARRVTVKYMYDPTLSVANKYSEKQFDNPEADTNTNRTISNDIKRRFLNEGTYFQKLAEDDPIAFNSLNEKIKFFHPAFHSITPEGFNSRLTFLQQCTRQGSTQNENRADNLAFGRPPVCILRVGDFYNTKIAMDSLNFAFEPLQWDLNPEGVGVQPMICTVDIGFYFLGGSSLKGPINKLQNAISHNFFANTEVYDPRADKIIKGEYVNNWPKTSKSGNVSDEETKNGGIEDNKEPAVNEVARSRNDNTSLTTQYSKKEIIENIEMEIYEVSDGEVSFILRRKNPSVSIVEPMRMKVFYGLGTEEETEISPLELTESLINTQIDKTVGFTLGDQLLGVPFYLRLVHDGMSIIGQELI